MNKEDLLQCVEEVVSAEARDETRVLTYFRDCEQLGLEILPCDINTSQAACAFEDEHHLRLGLSVLVSEEEPFINDLLTERQKKGKFRSFQNFCERLDLDQMPAEFLARLIESGAFDSTGESRARLFKGYPRILQGVRKAKADQASQQISLFAPAPAASKAESIPIDLPKVEEWTEEERVDHERQAVGFSFTAYVQQQAAPLAIQEPTESALAEPLKPEPVEPVQASSEPEPGEVPQEAVEISQESGEPASVESPQEQVEVSEDSSDPAPVEVSQEETASSVETREQSELPPVAISEEEPDEEDSFDRDETPPLPPEEFTVEEYETISAEEQIQQHASDELSQRDGYADDEDAAPATVVIRFRPTVTEDTLYQLRHLLEQHPGDASVILEFIDDDAPATLIKTHPDYAIDISEKFMQAVKQLVGEANIRRLDEASTMPG